MTKPYPFQKEGVKLISHYHGRALLADEMGLGKTIQSLVWMMLNKTFPTIVICPAGIKVNWSRECLQHINMRAEILYGRTPDEGRVNGSPRRRKLTIINYEILQEWLPYLQALRPKLIIIDECQYIKNPTTLRARLVRQLCKGVPYIIGLSGTPLTNRPSELFPILKILRPKIYKSFMAYAVEFCRARRTRWGWDYRGAKNLPRLHKNLKADYKDGGLMIRRLKKNVLKQLPEKIRFVVPLEIEEPKEYIEAEHNFISWLSKQSVHKAKKAAKAKQLVRMGYLKRLAAKLKLKSVFNWIDSFLEESDEKIIIYAIHKEIIQALRDNYKNTCVVLDGSTSHKMRQLGLDKFKHNKKIRILFGNINVVGVGLNIVEAAVVAFVELSDVPGDHIQGEDRAHRIGQKKKVMCYYLIAENTIEADQCRLMQRKQVNIETTLDGGTQTETLDIYDQLQKGIEGRRKKWLQKTSGGKRKSKRAGSPIS